MKTMQWKIKNAGEGKYHVELDGQKVPGMILGGNKWYVVQVGGIQICRTFRSRNAAAEYLVCREMGLLTGRE